MNQHKKSVNKPNDHSIRSIRATHNTICCGFLLLYSSFFRVRSIAAHEIKICAWSAAHVECAACSSWIATLRRRRRRWTYLDVPIVLSFRPSSIHIGRERTFVCAVFGVLSGLLALDSIHSTSIYINESIRRDTTVVSCGAGDDCASTYSTHNTHTHTLGVNRTANGNGMAIDRALGQCIYGLYIYEFFSFCRTEYDPTPRARSKRATLRAITRNGALLLSTLREFSLLWRLYSCC